MAFVEEVVKDRSKLHTPTLDYRGFVKDVAVFSLMVDALRSCGLTGKWKRALDIGGAEGAVARLMTGTGFSANAVCNDYVDLQDRLPAATFKSYFRRFRFARATGGRVPKFRIPNVSWNLGPTLDQSPTYKTAKLSGPPVLSEYIAGDFLEIDPARKFDLIASLLVMNYFDAEQKIAKVSSMLEDGGAFVLLVSSFWWPINASMVIGDFPYASQRLARPDLERYLKAHVPDDAEDGMKRYDYFHKTGHKPTLNDYIDMADRHGLSVMKADYLIPTATTHKKTPLPPFALEDTTDHGLSAVLSDIQTHRPDVRLIDLKAAYVMAVFRKRGPAKRSAAEMLDGR
jgi:hypothetical protein